MLERSISVEGLLVALSEMSEWWWSDQTSLCLNLSRLNGDKGKAANYVLFDG